MNSPSQSGDRHRRGTGRGVVSASAQPKVPGTCQHLLPAGTGEEIPGGKPVGGDLWELHPSQQGGLVFEGQRIQGGSYLACSNLEDGRNHAGSGLLVPKGKSAPVPDPWEVP